MEEFCLIIWKKKKNSLLICHSIFIWIFTNFNFLFQLIMEEKLSRKFCLFINDKCNLSVLIKIIFEHINFFITIYKFISLRFFSTFNVWRILFNILCYIFFLNLLFLMILMFPAFQKKIKNSNTNYKDSV